MDNNQHTNTSQSIAGHCLCKKIRNSFEDTSLKDDVGQVCFCHCAMCRHITGAISPAAMALPRSKLRFSGADDGNGTSTSSKEYPSSLSEYRSSKDTSRYFCSNCGGTVLFSYHAEPHTIWAYVATFDDKLQDSPELKRVLADKTVACHIFVKDRPGWYEVHNPDELPECDQLELWRENSCNPNKR